MTLQIVLAHVRYYLHRHGWPAAIGLLLIALAIGVQFFGVEQLRAQTVDLRAEQAAQWQRQVSQPDKAETANKRLVAFYASLPAASSTLDALNVIHLAAESNGIKLANGEYRLVREGNSPLQRYQITLPAHASYPHLRAWLAVVMNALPSAALDEISFRRDDAGSESVESRVRLTLFLRAD